MLNLAKTVLGYVHHSGVHVPIASVEVSRQRLMQISETARLIMIYENEHIWVRPFWVYRVKLLRCLLNSASNAIECRVRPKPANNLIWFGVFQQLIEPGVLRRLDLAKSFEAYP